MDGGLREKLMRDKIKRILKDGLLRSRAPAIATATNQPRAGVSAVEGGSQSSNIHGHSNVPENAQFVPPGCPYHTREEIISYYLKEVFPLQFGHYHGFYGESGAFWLRDLIQDTKPLYQATLTLSYIHMYQIVSSRQPTCADNSFPLGHSESLYVTAIAGLRKHVATIHDRKSTDSLRACVEALTCIIIHISIDVSVSVRFQG